MQNPIKGVSPLRICFGAITAIMLVIFFATLGAPLRDPLPLQLEVDNLGAISSSGDRSALLDREGSRLTVLNEDYQVENIIDTNPNAPNGERFSTVFTNSQSVYYSTATGDPDSAYLASEQVYSADASGNNRTEVYRRAYDEDANILEPAFMKIVAGDDDVLLLCKSTDGRFLEIISLSKDPGAVIASMELPNDITGILSADYDAASGRFAFVSYLRECYVGTPEEGAVLLGTDFSNAAFAGCAWGADGCLYGIDVSSKALVRVDLESGGTVSCPIGETSQTISGVDGERGSAIVCGSSSGFVVFLTSDFVSGSSEVKPYATVESLPYSMGFAFQTVIAWVAIAYLAVCALIAMARIVVRLWRQEKGDKIFHAALVAGCVVLLVGISFFCTRQFYVFAENCRFDSIASLCSMGASVAEDRIAEAQDRSEQGNGYTVDEILASMEEMGATLSSHSMLFAENDIGLHAAISIWDGDDAYVLEADAQGYGFRSVSIGGTQIDALTVKAFADDSQGEIIRSTFSDTTSENLVVYRSVHGSSGEVVGLILVACEVSDLAEAYNSMCIDLAITILAVFGAIVLVVLEGRGLVEALRMRRREKKQGTGQPEVWAARPLVFLLAMAWGCDSAIVVLVAQDMLNAIGATNVEFLVGLPAMALSIGGLLGNVLFGLLSTKVGGRKLCTVGAALGGVFLVLSFFAVLQNAFFLFCVFKFLVGTFLNLSYAIAYALPLRTGDEKKRSRLFQDCTMAALSGNAIGSLVCGYVAQYLGNSWIYLAGAIPVLVALVAGFRLLPARMPIERVHGESAESNRSERGKTGSIPALFLSIPVLSMIVGIMFPMALASGYRNILFPLFMDDFGLSKTYINNIVVLSNVVVFAVSPLVAGLMKGVKQQNAVILSTLFSAAVLAWFMVNSTMAWGIIALVLLALSAKVNAPALKVLLPREARARGVPEAKANNFIGVVQNFIEAARSPLLGSLVVLGQSFACLCVGAACAIGAGIFAVGTSRSAMREEAADDKP